MAKTLMLSSLQVNSFSYTYSSPSMSIKQPSLYNHTYFTNQPKSRKGHLLVLHCRCGNRSSSSGPIIKYGYGLTDSNHRKYEHRHYHNRQARQASNQPFNPDQEGGDGYEREEWRWLREEKRWLREEQRWLREEARWNTERESLLSHVSDLQLRIQHLESELQALRLRASNDDNVIIDAQILTQINALLQKQQQQVLPSSNLGIPEQTARPFVLEEGNVYESPSNDSAPKPTPISSPVSTPKAESETTSKSKSKLSDSQLENQQQLKKKKSAATLRIGSEGPDVQTLQEALMSLGFYCGEEDMEFSSFYDDTERAVKTWQASVHVREDGIMTPELLEKLYSSGQIKDSGSSDDANGTLKPGSKSEVVVKQDIDYSQNRVYLLGENRWEDPSRLKTGSNKMVNGTIAQVSTTKCPTCRGEGRLMCMECDGSGEPNVESQFIEWVEEEAKCPYCEGLGFTVCDVCHGKVVS